MNEERSSRSFKATGGVALLVALPLLYVLSAGPVSYIFEKSSWCRRRPRLLRVVAVAYTPLGPLASNKSLGPAFLSYVSWWMDLAHEPYTGPSDPFAPAVQEPNDSVAPQPSDPFAQDPK